MATNNPFDTLERKIDALNDGQREIYNVVFNKMMNQLLDYEELSELTGYAVQTLRGKKAKKEIPEDAIAIMGDGHPRFIRGKIIEWMQAKK